MQNGRLHRSTALIEGASERVKRHLAEWYATVDFVANLSRFVASRAKPVDALVPSVEAVRRFRPHGRSPRPWLSPRYDAPMAA